MRPQNTALDGLFEIPTFQQVIDLAKAKGVGIYPETKHPTFFRSLGFSFDAPLLGTLRRNGLDRPDAKVFIQSFDSTNLQWLRSRTGLPLVQLVEATGPHGGQSDLVTTTGLRRVAQWADAVGVGLADTEQEACRERNVRTAGILDHSAQRHWHLVPGEQLFGLVLHQIHGLVLL